MRTIRASEIGAFLFCRQAWYLQQQGVESQNQAELAGGTAYHQQQGKKVARSGVLRWAGWFILLLALAILAVGLTQTVLP
ncbi:MAG TPA: hypothetical protein VN376_10640 [Longilinea sp.]|nr:hypothetical protein [Longilinea sp.]